MKTKLGLGTFLLAACVMSWAADTASENLVENGGFEEVRQVDLTGGHFHSAIKGGCVMDGELFANVPTSLDQLSGAKKFIVVEGAAGQEVHTGKRALLFNGGFYLRSMFPCAKDDVFEISYFAKGNSKVSVFFNLIDAQGEYKAQGLPKVYPIEVANKDEWVEVKQTIPIKDEGQWKIFVRLSAEGDVCIDDLVIRKAGSN